MRSVGDDPTPDAITGYAKRLAGVVGMPAAGMDSPLRPLAPAVARERNHPLAMLPAVNTCTLVFNNVPDFMKDNFQPGQHIFSYYDEQKQRLYMVHYAALAAYLYNTKPLADNAGASDVLNTFMSYARRIAYVGVLLVASKISVGWAPSRPLYPTGTNALTTMTTNEWQLTVATDMRVTMAASVFASARAPFMSPDEVRVGDRLSFMLCYVAESKQLMDGHHELPAKHMRQSTTLPTGWSAAQFLSLQHEKRSETLAWQNPLDTATASDLKLALLPCVGSMMTEHYVNIVASPVYVYPVGTVLTMEDPQENTRPGKAGITRHHGEERWIGYSSSTLGLVPPSLCDGSFLGNLRNRSALVMQEQSDQIHGPCLVVLMRKGRSARKRGLGEITRNAIYDPTSALEPLHALKVVNIEKLIAGSQTWNDGEKCLLESWKAVPTDAYLSATSEAEAALIRRVEIAEHLVALYVQEQSAGHKVAAISALLLAGKSYFDEKDLSAYPKLAARLEHVWPGAAPPEPILSTPPTPPSTGASSSSSSSLSLRPTPAPAPSA